MSGSSPHAWETRLLVYDFHLFVPVHPHMRGKLFWLACLALGVALAAVARLAFCLLFLDLVGVLELLLFVFCVHAIITTPNLYR